MPDRALLLRLEARRTEATSLFRELTPLPVISYGIEGVLHHSAISRQRNGDDSLVIFRQDVVFEAMAQAGSSRAEMMAIVAHYLAVIEELRPLSTIDARQAILRAQASDTTEDYHETQALLDPARIGRWIEATELHIADAIVAVACLRRDRAQIARAA